MKTAKNRQAVLFIMSGLPASGKSTLAKHIASDYGTVHLRIDTLEQSLKDICRLEVTGEAYRIAYRIAADNLKRGLDVVADCCNPLHMTRKEWEDCAREAGGNFIHIEISCSDEKEYRKRVENWESDIAGLELPDWEGVKNRYYEDWEEATDRIRIDTAHKDVADSRYELEQEIQSRLYPSAENRYLR